MTSDNAPYTFAYLIYKASADGENSGARQAIQMAAGAFMTVVPAILFTVFQKQLTDGVLTSGLKG